MKKRSSQSRFFSQPLVFIAVIFLTAWFPVTLVANPLGSAEQKVAVLDNGLTVLVARQSHTPEVAISLAYKVGSVDEQAGEYGFAHLLEHMVFKGTATLNEGDYRAIAKKYGATTSAYTTYDRTVYYCSTDRENWSSFLPIFADTMSNARIDSEHLASELKAVIQEMRMFESEPKAPFYDSFFARLFGDKHPYGRKIIGTKEDLALVTASALKKFYNKFYHPHNAVLALVGDIDVDAALCTVQKIFAQNTGNKSFSYVRNIPAVQTASGEQKKQCVTVPLDIPTPYMWFAWPTCGGASHAEKSILDAISTLCMSELHGRLRHRLFDTTSLAHSVQSGHQSMADLGWFLVSISCDAENKDRCAAIVREEIARISAEGVSDEEIAYLQIQHRSAMADVALKPSDWADRWCASFLSTGRTDLFVQEYVQYDDLTSQKIQAVAQKYLDLGLMTQFIGQPFTEQQKGAEKEKRAVSDQYYQQLLAHHQRTTPCEPLKAVYNTPPYKELSGSIVSRSGFFTGRNGMQVVCDSELTLPKVTVRFAFKDHGYQDLTVKKLLVSIMLDVLCKPTEKFSREQLFGFFEKRGADISVSDYGITLTCFPEDITVLLRHLCTLFTEQVITQENLEKVKKNYTMRLQMAKEDAQRVARNGVYQLFFGHDERYDNDFEKQLSSIDKLTVADMYMFCDEKIHPSQFVCAMSGPLSVAEQREALSAAGLLAWRADEPRTVDYQTDAQEVINTKVRRVHHEVVRDQTVVMLCTPVDADNNNLRKMVIRHFITSIMGRSVSSRLYSIREKTGLFYYCFADFAGIGITPSLKVATIEVMVNPENVDLALQLLKEQLDILANNAITADEVANARRIFIKDIYSLYANSRLRSYMFAAPETSLLPTDWAEQFCQIATTLTAEEINEYAHDFAAEQWSIVTAGRTTTQRAH